MPFPPINAPAPWPPGLTNQDGVPVVLSQYQGKSVLLYFYPKDDTPGCTIEACSFRDHAPAIPNLVILGASLDDGASHRAFKAKHQLPFDLVVDANQALAKAYGTLPEGSTKTTRSSFLIGPDGKLVQVWPKVDPKTHWDEVRAAIGH